MTEQGGFGGSHAVVPEELCEKYLDAGKSAFIIGR